MISQSTSKSPLGSQIPDGQERLATQSERDDVTRVLDTHTMMQSKVPSEVVVDRRECGDEVNRFLLCTLVNNASRYIKASAERSGEPVPMATIVRGVLRSFRIAAGDHDGPLNGSVLDLPALTTLNSRVLQSEIGRYDRARVKRNEARLAARKNLDEN